MDNRKQGTKKSWLPRALLYHADLISKRIDRHDLSLDESALAKVKQRLGTDSTSIASRRKRARFARDLILGYLARRRRQWTAFSSLGLGWPTTVYHLFR